MRVVCERASLWAVMGDVPRVDVGTVWTSDKRQGSEFGMCAERVESDVLQCGQVVGCEARGVAGA